MKVATLIKPNTRDAAARPLPAPNSDFYPLAAVVARSQGFAGTAWGRLAAGSVSGVGEMVNVPASPVTQLPHQRLARSETTLYRLVQVLQESSLRLFARNNTPQTGSNPRFRNNWRAKKMLTSPPWHGACFIPSQSGIPRCFGVRIQQWFLPMKALICY
jgi:hypothetical protein